MYVFIAQPQPIFGIIMSGSHYVFIMIIAIIYISC